MNKTKTDTISRKHIANVLIVNEDTEFSRLVLTILARKGIRGHLVDNHKSAIDLISKGSCDLIFIREKTAQRANQPGRQRDSFELVGKIKTIRPELPVVMVADSSCAVHDTKCEIHNKRYVVRKAVRAIRQGCCDFLIEPIDQEKIETLLDTFLPNHDYSTITSAHDGTRCLYEIVGKNTKLIRAVDLARKIAPTSAPVLVSGESGTGKELIAYLIHHESRRSQGPYIRLNCAAVSDSLLESELFGHEKGAFTGAYAQRKGRFELAHGGTLLLDEITETPIRFQAKLLRILEQQDFERVGGNESVKIDVRIISTTNKNLLQEVQKGRFRQDLYYRLSAIRLALCPLRERKDDLSDLVWHFVNLYSREVQRRIIELDPVMMDIFAKYHWPGNIRQLRNVVRTSLILGAGQTLSLADVSWLFDELQPLPQQKFNINDQLNGRIEPISAECTQDDIQNSQHTSGLGGLPLEQVERRAILETLRQTGGNQTKAAKVLGISDRTLRDRIHRYRKEGCLQPV